MSEWKLRRTLQFERWRVDVNVSLPGSGEFCRYAEQADPLFALLKMGR